MYLFQTFLINLTDSIVERVAWTIGQNPEEGAQKAVAEFKTTEFQPNEEKKYHIQVVAVGALPGIQPRLIRPTPQQTAEIISH